MKKVVLSTISTLIVMIANAQTPNLQWAKSMGGTGGADGYSIALDASGNTYTIGNFSGTVDFDPGPGTFNLTAASGSFDIFISKLDVAGNFVWAKKIGETPGGFGQSIVTDMSGNIYITGYFMGTVDFDPGAGVFDLTACAGGGESIFIAKYDSYGNFVWVKTMCGTIGVLGYSIAIDQSGNVYTTGEFTDSIDFDPGPGVFNLTTLYYQTDIFISKLDSAGNFVWAKSFGGASGAGADNLAVSIKADTAGYIYTTGHFKGTVDFDPGAGIFNLSASGDHDIFISKLDAAGNFVWARGMGGTSYDRGNSVAIDASGNVYTTGFFADTVDFDPGLGVFNLTAVGSSNTFISKIDPAGNFVWAKNIGGVEDSDFVSGHSIALDASGNIYTAGSYGNTIDFDPGAGVDNLSSVIGQSMFILKLNPSGNFIWAANVEGTNNVEGNGIAIDAADNIYTTGVFDGTADFDPGAGVYNLSAVPGSGNAFVLKLSQTPLGITENTNENSFSIYPNPTNGVFNLKMNEFDNLKIQELKVYNVLSECVYQLNASQINSSSTLQIDLTDQANGIYFIKVMSEDNVVSTKKIVKE